MSDEFEGFGDKIWDAGNNEIEGVALSPTKPNQPTLDELKARGGITLVKASSLAPELAHEEPAELGFEPDNRYKGFLILPRSEWPQEPGHAHLTGHFYVASPKGTIGLVPWAGSTIVWPWEAGWIQDLHRAEVQSFLKEEKEVKKRG